MNVAAVLRTRLWFSRCVVDTKNNLSISRRALALKEATKERILRPEYLTRADRIDDKLLDVVRELHALKGEHDIKETLKELIKFLKTNAGRKNK